MQSNEAGLCGPKLQSAPEISKGDDQEHILYCPECTARLRLIGIKLNEPSPVTVRNDSTRKTLPDFLSEPNPAPVASRVEARHDGFLPLTLERRESASRLPVVAELRESPPRLPLTAERHESASRIPVVAERRQSATQIPLITERKESAPQVLSAKVVDIDATTSNDDDEPTRVIRNSEVLAEVRAELSAQPSTIIITNNVAPVLEDEPTPPLKSQTASASVANCTDAVVTEVDVKAPDSLEKINIEVDRIPQSALSDAPITRELTSASARSIGGRNRQLAIGVSVAALVLIGAFATRGKMTDGTKEQKSLAASSVEQPVLNVTQREEVSKAPVQPTQDAVNQDTVNQGVVVPETSVAPRAVKAKSSLETVKLNASSRNVKPTESPSEERSSDAIKKESTLAKKEAAKKETTSEEVEVAAPSEPHEAVFDAEAAVSALDNAASRASSCRQPSDPSGVAVVTITFAPSGRVTTATISGPPFVGTATGSCIAAAMRTAKVPSFSGQFKTVKKTVTIN
jgi:hypothetical protein